IAKLNSALTVALADPVVRQQLAKLGQGFLRATSRRPKPSARCKRRTSRSGGRSSRRRTSSRNEGLGPDVAPDVPFSFQRRPSLPVFPVNNRENTGTPARRTSLPERSAGWLRRAHSCEPDPLRLNRTSCMGPRRKLDDASFIPDSCYKVE